MSGRVVVTGGLGFIGSAFVRALAAEGQAVLNVDADTYAGDERRLADVGPGLAETMRMDVCGDGLVDLVRAERPPLLVHFAAETHVTRSEDDGDTFFRTNVDGTRNVLDAAAAAGVERVVHISTDEIYGPCPADPFREDQKLPGEGLATSAYDRLAVVIARPTNCIGPWQHPEKAIPRWATRALRGERLPVWGDGLQIRDWMFVDDAVSGLRVLAERGEPGTAYNLGPAGEAVPNVEIARMVARAAGAGEDAVYLSAYDRPRHDRRYAVSTERVAALGWAATRTVQAAVVETVAWYRDHAGWWQTLVPEAERLYAD